MCTCACLCVWVCVCMHNIMCWRDTIHAVKSAGMPLCCNLHGGIFDLIRMKPTNGNSILWWAVGSSLTSKLGILCAIGLQLNFSSDTRTVCAMVQGLMSVCSNNNLSNLSITHGSLYQYSVRVYIDTPDEGHLPPSTSWVSLAYRARDSQKCSGLASPPGPSVRLSGTPSLQSSSPLLGSCIQPMKWWWS